MGQGDRPQICRERLLMVLTLVAGIITLSVLVIVSELRGTLSPLKSRTITYQEFGIGFPPRIYGKKWGETIYSINWIPFGGFNKLSGEVDPKEQRALAARSHAVRLFVMDGGIIMNLLLPLVLLAVAYMVPHDIVTGKIVVQEVAACSPAHLAGVRPGDNIIAINGHKVNNTGDLSRYVLLKMGAKITLSLVHSDGTPATAQVLARWKPPAGQSSTGSVSATGKRDHHQGKPPVLARYSRTALTNAARRCFHITMVSWG